MTLNRSLLLVPFVAACASRATPPAPAPESVPTVVLTAATDPAVALASLVDATYLASRQMVVPVELDVQALESDLQQGPLVLAALAGTEWGPLLPTPSPITSEVLAAARAHPHATLRVRGRLSGAANTVEAWQQASAASSDETVRHPELIIEQWQMAQGEGAESVTPTAGAAAEAAIAFLRALQNDDAAALAQAVVFREGLAQRVRAMFNEPTLPEGVRLEQLESYLEKEYPREELAACSTASTATAFEPCPLFWQLEHDLIAGVGLQVAAVERAFGTAIAARGDAAARLAGWLSRLPPVNELIVSSVLAGYSNEVRVYLPSGACEFLQLPCPTSGAALPTSRHELFLTVDVVQQAEGFKVLWD